LRRVYRARLPLASRIELRKRSSKVAALGDVRQEWRRYRSSVAARPVLDALKQMAGARERCIYCSDSRAGDIDHFVPMALDGGLAFSWRNMQWCCTICNRKKSSKFPLDDFGNALLLDPTREDPWASLILDTSSGVLAPRMVGAVFDPRGEATLLVLDILNHEAIIEGRARGVRRIREAVQSAVEGGDKRQSRESLMRTVREDDLGISAWFAFWEGASEQPFLDLQAKHAPLWRRFVIVCAQSRIGTPPSLSTH
jgi:5-methylcytosine-specific restriction endonuclease McrA